MPAWEIAIGAAVFALSVACNSVLSAVGGAANWRASRLGVISFLLFAATLYVGYRWYGWLGGVVALVGQVVGMVILAPLLKNRLRPGRPRP